jgi:hypothetical protein
MAPAGQIRYENLSAVRVTDAGVDYGDPPVRLGDAIVPPRAAYVVDGANGSPSIRVEFEIRDGQSTCALVHIEAAAAGRGIRSGDLALPSLDRLGLDVFTELAMSEAERPSDWFIHPRDHKRRTHVRGEIRSAATVAELEEVARVYRANVHGQPRRAVREQMGYDSDRTASRRIEAARTQGYLPRTTQGKRKA